MRLTGRLRYQEGSCISTNFSPGCARLPKALGASQLKYVLPQSWLLALCYKWGNRCATACSAESPEVQVPLAFTESWIWSHFKMLISCTRWKQGCLGFWSCKRYTDNFTRGTSESCLNYSVLLQTPVKTGTEIRNDFLKWATNSKGIITGNEGKKIKVRFYNGARHILTEDLLLSFS